MTPELADQVEHVAAEAVLVGGGVAGLVDAGVDAAAHVLDERAEQAAVDRPDGEGRVEADRSRALDRSSGSATLIPSGADRHQGRVRAGYNVVTTCRIVSTTL